MSRSSTARVRRGAWLPARSRQKLTSSDRKKTSFFFRKSQDWVGNFRLAGGGDLRFRELRILTTLLVEMERTSSKWTDVIYCKDAPSREGNLKQNTTTTFLLCQENTSFMASAVVYGKKSEQILLLRGAQLRFMGRFCFFFSWHPFNARLIGKSSLIAWKTPTDWRQFGSNAALM